MRTGDILSHMREREREREREVYFVLGENKECEHDHQAVGGVKDCFDGHGQRHRQAGKKGERSGGVGSKGGMIGKYLISLWLHILQAAVLGCPDQELHLLLFTRE